MIKRGLVALAWLGVLPCSLWSLLRWTELATTPQGMLLLVFDAWVYASLLPVALFASLARRGRLLLVVGLNLLVVLGIYGGRWWPQPTNSAPQDVRIMTWNVYYDTRDIGGLVATIRQQQADIVVLQEYNFQLDPQLPEALADLYPYAALNPHSGAGGLATLSRWPVTELAPVARGVDSCGCQYLEIATPSGPTRLINTHPHIPLASFKGVYTKTQQDPTFDQLLKLIADQSQPLILAGDLNTTERQPNYLRLRQQLGDAYQQKGWGLGYTFPSNDTIPKAVRLDYIMPNLHWQPLRAWTGTANLSDHGFVIADLQRLRQ
ncbi:endonuclease/exonuclease/phosphatase family protein [Herpetosiphon giganteus]|uniref:endonuclease/exonuclease/phosphatase family protein n=1 Tax=Herpetosiphon giganteus TaxID=2029754 RepID=UPI00195C9FD9|nr:endonuclease/exonuclease/phosphatase family protein [Herpetosiphon giganteus]MBM7843086.1 endonuclease/exonuclease/phosphatase (EEP) superfamily protein YafD [Herpetosiphon giganteus]